MSVRVTGKLAKRLAKEHGVELPKKKAKYRAVPTIVDEIRFSSKKEAKRYVELLIQQQAGEITDLELQPRFPLTVNGVLIGNYVADFRYKRLWEFHEYDVIIEDVKGFKTDVYLLKKKIMEALYGVRILET